MLLEENILKLVDKPLKALGYEEIQIKYVKEFGNFYLHVYLDKDDAIDLEDIVKANDIISPILDEADLIQNEYILDVTSFGAEKPIDITKLNKYVGKYINLHLANPYKGLNYLEGDLKFSDDNEVILIIKDKSQLKEVTLKRNDIDKARLAIKF